MDTRKLKIKSLTRYEASIYFAHPDPERPNDHGEQVAELTSSEDAAEIVHRWNAHNALVEALEEALNNLQSPDEGGLTGAEHDAGAAEDTIIKARQALEAAKAQ
jgi:hypothetical protein